MTPHCAVFYVLNVYFFPIYNLFGELYPCHWLLNTDSIKIWKLCIKTRMTTFIETKFKISNDQMNIDKYRLAANITEYHIEINHYNESLLQIHVVQRVIFGKVQYQIWNPHQISNWNRSRNNEIMLELKMPKSSCLKWTYGRSSIG